jgi:anti-sigma factor RsiW
MNCKDTEQFIHGYLDGELDLVRSLEVEQHLNECPQCAHSHRTQQSLRASLASGALYFEAPKGLEKRTRSALQ